MPGPHVSGDARTRGGTRAERGVGARLGWAGVARDSGPGEKEVGRGKGFGPLAFQGFFI